ncbi:hypothetical protein [Brucella pituitosa]|uniref:hypothetical protein n=1 Tax=Brucella pituitosa TaxID=571256 RepID=UPI003F4AE5CC
MEGSSEFTTTGSALEVADIQPGDSIITASGLTLIIESITGQNSGTLMHPCSMIAAGANQPLRIRYQPEGSRLAGMAASLFQMLGNGNLYSLGELEGEEGQFLRFLAPGVLEAVAGGNLDALRELDNIHKLTSLQNLSLSAQRLIGTDAHANIAEIDPVTLPISNATASALNNKLSLAGGFNIVRQSVNLDNFDAKSGLYIKSSRPNTAIGQTNYSGSVDFSLGSSSIRGSASLFERIGNETVLTFNVQAGGVQSWFEMANHGAFRVPGALTAGSKSFIIDHVKDRYNKYLVYMSTEAPKAGIEDWGSIRLLNGQAEVDLDIAAGQMHGTFALLTQKAIVVSVNNLDGDTRLRAGRIIDGKFTIFADDPECDDEVTWHVKAERADPFIKSHPYCDPETGLLIPEHEKED